MNDFNSSFGSSSKVESQLIPNSLRGSDQEMMLRSAKHHHKRSGSDETLEDSQKNLEKLISAYNNSKNSKQSERQKDAKSANSKAKKHSDDAVFWMLSIFSNQEIQLLLGIFKLNFSEEENAWIDQHFISNPLTIKVEEFKYQEDYISTDGTHTKVLEDPGSIEQNDEQPSQEFRQQEKETFKDSSHSVIADEIGFEQDLSQPVNAIIPQADNSKQMENLRIIQDKIKEAIQEVDQEQEDESLQDIDQQLASPIQEQKLEVKDAKSEILLKKDYHFIGTSQTQTHQDQQSDSFKSPKNGQQRSLRDLEYKPRLPTKSPNHQEIMAMISQTKDMRLSVNNSSSAEKGIKHGRNSSPIDTGLVQTVIKRANESKSKAQKKLDEFLSPKRTVDQRSFRNQVDQLSQNSGNSKLSSKSLNAYAHASKGIKKRTLNKSENGTIEPLVYKIDLDKLTKHERSRPHQTSSFTRRPHKLNKEGVKSLNQFYDKKGDPRVSEIPISLRFSSTLTNPIYNDVFSKIEALSQTKMYSRDKKNQQAQSKIEFDGQPRDPNFENFKQKYFAKIHLRNGPDSRGIRSTRRIRGGVEQYKSTLELGQQNSHFLREDFSKKNFFDSKISNLDLSDSRLLNYNSTNDNQGTTKPKQITPIKKNWGLKIPICGADSDLLSTQFSSKLQAKEQPKYHKHQSQSLRTAVEEKQVFKYPGGFSDANDLGGKIFSKIQEKALKEKMQKIKKIQSESIFRKHAAPGKQFSESFAFRQE